MKNFTLKSTMVILFFVVIIYTLPSTIYALSPDFSQSTLASGLSNPQDITFFCPGGDYGPNLFVTEYDSDQITKITPAGTQNTFANNIDYAVAILFGSGAYGNFLYASESYSSDGNIVRIYPDGHKENFAGGIDSPLDMAWGIGGAFGQDLYVASANANKIVKVTPTGQVIDFVTNLDRPSVLAFSPGGDFGNYLYVTNTDDGQIVRIAPDKSTSVFISGLTRPIGLAFGHNTPFGEFLYVSEKTTGEILKISPTGSISKFADGLQEPIEIHFSHGGLYGNDMLIAESDAGRITKITSIGAPLVDMSPLAGDVGLSPFTFSFTISDPQGISTLTDFKFIFNGEDVTISVLDALVASITHIDENSITVSVPRIKLPVGVYSIEIRLTDTDGHQGYAKVTYSIRLPRR